MEGGLMIFTNHLIERARERGIEKDTLDLAISLGSRYYATETANGNRSKRIFNPINLMLALFDKKINKDQYFSIEHLCLIMNKNNDTLITIYKDRKEESN